MRTVDHCPSRINEIGLPGPANRRWNDTQQAKLERKIRQQAREDDFLKLLAAHRGAADAAGSDWKSAVYRKVQEEVKAHRGLTVESMAELGRVSRSGFYRFDDAEPDPDRDMELRDAIQKIAVEWPCYGRPRMIEELRRRGWVVNPKTSSPSDARGQLVGRAEAKFVVTTDSNRGRKIYPKPGALK